jgi:hypothetical protein
LRYTQADPNTHVNLKKKNLTHLSQNLSQRSDLQEEIRYPNH